MRFWTLAMLLVSACGGPVLTGTVVSKEAVPERRWTELVCRQHVDLFDPFSACALYVEEERIVPPSWVVTVDGWTGDEKRRIENKRVSREVYERCEFGGQWPCFEVSK